MSNDGRVVAACLPACADANSSALRSNYSSCCLYEGKPATTRVKLIHKKWNHGRRRKTIAAIDACVTWAQLYRILDWTAGYASDGIQSAAARCLQTSFRTRPYFIQIRCIYFRIQNKIKLARIMGTDGCHIYKNERIHAAKLFTEMIKKRKENSHSVCMAVMNRCHWSGDMIGGQFNNVF